MKHIFIVNPAAGANDSTETIKAILEKHHPDIDYEVYTTVSSGDATQYIKSVLANSTQEYRFYACGGDGTLNEVINGSVGYENASVAVYPCGSGNDYIKYYGSTQDFFDIDALINAPSLKVDVLKVCDKYAINAVHFGLDSFVLKTMLKVRRFFLLGGKNAYTTGVITAFIGGMKTACTLFADGKPVGEDKLLLCTLCNGKFVGGGYKCAPRSQNDDELIELCYVKPVSRLKFLTLMNTYKKGGHLEDPRFAKYLTYKRVKKVELKSDNGVYISIDGELEKVYDCTIEIIPQAINFAVPEKLLAESKPKETAKSNQ